MATFVLVPGAWLGAWVWQATAAELQVRGHHAVPLTLTGATLEDHVAQVLARVAEHPGCVLVGHSYAGVVVGQVADRAETLVQHTVYVDANLPHDGEALTTPWSQRGREFIEAEIAENGGFWPAPEAGDFAEHDLDADRIAWLLPQLTPHPGQTIFDPVSLSRPAHGTYVASLRPTGVSAEVQDLRLRPGWRVLTLDTGHYPMISAPSALAELLVCVAPADA